MCYNDPIKVWDMKKEKHVTLRPYMQWNSDICTFRVTDDQWEDALRHSVTDDEWDMILKSRKRNGN